MSVKNYSASQKTVKSMAIAYNVDVWSLDRVLLYANYMNISLIPDGTIMDDYYDYFETLLEEVEVPEKYFYSPTGFAEYYYGDPGLDFLVLYFAKIMTLFEFNRSTITALPPGYLKEFNRLVTYKKKEVTENRNNPPVYTAFDDVTSKTQTYENYFSVYDT